MKRILRAIALLFIPIFMYAAVFIVFEPNNYFGLRKEATGTDIMAALRQYEASPQDSIILGDSRLAKLDLAIAQEQTGLDYANLAFGGAGFKEQIDILEWAINTNPNLKNVVFQVSFYTLNASYNQDRMVIRALNNPLVYMTNLGYNLNMLTNLYNHLNPNLTPGDEAETMDPADYKYVSYLNPEDGQTYTVREKLASHLTDVYGRSKGWKLNTEQLERLMQMIDENPGIQFSLVLPPVHPDLHTFITDPLGITDAMQPVLEELQNSGALVIDYEFSSSNLPDTDFFDLFHLDEKRGLDKWTTDLFSMVAQQERQGA
ncbi:MAG: hypothetical protein ACK5JF_11190 [Oscillospiraceae bacterium]